MKKYDVVVNGVKTTLLLNDEDATRRGLLKPPAADKPAAKAAKAPANKAVKPPANKSE